MRRVDLLPEDLVAELGHRLSKCDMAWHTRGRRESNHIMWFDEASVWKPAEACPGGGMLCKTDAQQASYNSRPHVCQVHIAVESLRDLLEGFGEATNDGSNLLHDC